MTWSAAKLAHVSTWARMHQGGGEKGGHEGRGCQGHSSSIPRTFFGGTIATADLGAILM